ncbi:MAG: hypothetical protein ACLP2U_14175 [Syntrophobacteraceae bacterium]
MLYLAHFSFLQKLGEEGFGYFTCLVEARNVDVAEKKLKTLLKRTGKETSVLERVTSVYLDEVTEIKEIPKEGIFGFLRVFKGKLDSSLTISLGGQDVPGCTAYGHGSEEGELEPFLSSKTVLS